MRVKEARWVRLALEVGGFIAALQLAFAAAGDEEFGAALGAGVALSGLVGHGSGSFPVGLP